MPVSEAVVQQLERLKENIQQFLKLHKNPYDSSQYNELAEKLERLEAILKNVNMNGGGNTTVGGDSGNDNNGEPNTGDHSCPNDSTGDSSSLEVGKTQLEEARAGAREALATVEDLNAKQVSIADTEKAKIEAYVAAAQQFLQTYESASVEEKSSFDQNNSGYIAEIQQSHAWNANDFLPRAGDENNSGDGSNESSLAGLKTQVEQARAGAREALATVEDLNAKQVDIADEEKAKIEAYVAAAQQFLQAYESAPAEEKANFDQANSGYVAEIQQSHAWNANEFLPRTEAQQGDSNTSDNSVDTSNLARTISASVGKGGVNKEADVNTVKGWLNSHGANLPMNGQADNQLTNEIKKFQRRLGQTHPDGKVDPGYDTFKGLIGEKPVGPASSSVSSIIQGGESGAAGYNAYNRGTTSNGILGPNGPRELVKMTVATIMANQNLSQNHPDFLFAVGKYQMVPDTLKEGVERINLDTSLLYNEETQELLFSRFLMKAKRPAIHAYITGTGTARAAGIAGAMEWASIACPPNTFREDPNGKVDVSGKSYYDGVGGNSAHITHDEFISALDESKADYEKNISSGMNPQDAYDAAVVGVEKKANSGGSSGSSSDNNGTTPDDNSNNNTNNNSSSSGSLSASVGEGGANQEADVRLVQQLLNKKGARLDEDGKIGRLTIGAIKRFQGVIEASRSGLVEPNSATWRALNEDGHDMNSAGQTAGGVPEHLQNEGVSSYVENVPYYSQRDNAQQWDRTCNVSSCSMATALLYPGLFESDDDYFNHLQAYGDTTVHSAHTQMLADKGVQSQYFTNLDYADLEASLEAGKPVVIGVLHKGPLHAPYGGHMITIIGKYNGGFVAHDPWGTPFAYEDPNGSNVLLPYESLDARWLVEGPGSGHGRIFS